MLNGPAEPPVVMATSKSTEVPGHTFVAVVLMSTLDGHEHCLWIGEGLSYPPEQSYWSVTLMSTGFTSEIGLLTHSSAPSCVQVMPPTELRSVIEMVAKSPVSTFTLIWNSVAPNPAFTSSHSVVICAVTSGLVFIVICFDSGLVPVIHAELLVTVTSAVLLFAAAVISRSAVVLPSLAGVVADQSKVGAAPPPCRLITDTVNGAPSHPCV